MRSQLAVLLAFAAVALAATPALAQQEILLEVRVTSVAGGAVYVDLGADDGLREGDRVRFPLDGTTAASGVARSVSQHGARVELDPGSPSPPPGARGEVRVPAERFAGGVPPARAAPITWTQTEQEWQPGRPLLAPAFGRSAAERERSLWGRAWLRYDASQDMENDARYGLGAVGADLALQNAFGLGDSLRVTGEVYARSSSVDDGQYEYDETRGRLDRFSWLVGDQPDRRHRFEAGRFLQREFPELGVLDGAEWSARTSGQSRFGASVGWIPDAFEDFESFEDLQAALYYRLAFDRDARHTLAAAYQSTWHDGTSDRNLFVLRGESYPTESLAVRGTAWVDLYTSDDTIKGSGAELTEAQLSTSWSGESGGVGVFLLHRKWPELLREEYAGLTPATVRDGELDRAALTAWTPLGESTRLDARAEVWSDQEDEGVTGEIGTRFDGALGAGSSLALAAQYADGTYSSGPGARLGLYKTYGTTSVSLGWQSFWYQQKDIEFRDDELLQHTVYGTIDRPIGERWTLSLLGDWSFGDELSAWTAGILLQTRF